MCLDFSHEMGKGGEEAPAVFLSTFAPFHRPCNLLASITAPRAEEVSLLTYLENKRKKKTLLCRFCVKKNCVRLYRIG